MAELEQTPTQKHDQYERNLGRLDNTNNELSKQLASAKSIVEGKLRSGKLQQSEAVVRVLTMDKDREIEEKLEEHEVKVKDLMRCIMNAKQKLQQGNFDRVLEMENAVKEQKSIVEDLQLEVKILSMQNRRDTRGSRNNSLSSDAVKELRREMQEHRAKLDEISRQVSVVSYIHLTGAPSSYHSRFLSKLSAPFRNTNNNTLDMESIVQTAQEMQQVQEMKGQLRRATDIYNRKNARVHELKVVGRHCTHVLARLPRSNTTLHGHTHKQTHTHAHMLKSRR